MIGASSRFFLRHPTHEAVRSSGGNTAGVAVRSTEARSAHSSRSALGAGNNPRRSCCIADELVDIHSRPALPHE